jgi:hypothetical protein
MGMFASNYGFNDVMRQFLRWDFRSQRRTLGQIMLAVGEIGVRQIMFGRVGCARPGEMRQNAVAPPFVHESEVAQ